MKNTRRLTKKRILLTLNGEILIRLIFHRKHLCRIFTARFSTQIQVR